jgi:hypothetical protein
LKKSFITTLLRTTKTGGPALDIGQTKLLWRALGENTGYTFSIFESTVAPGMGIPQLGYPLYIILLIGVTHILGGVGLLIPNTTRLTEWIYAF